MEAAYQRYVHVLLGKVEPRGPEWNEDPGYTHELDLYHSLYLPMKSYTGVVRLRICS